MYNQGLRQASWMHDLEDGGTFSKWPSTRGNSWTIRVEACAIVGVIPRSASTVFLKSRFSFLEQREDVVRRRRSRSPVGSSATINVGSVTMARAMATRCC